jgi:yeast amino acid transporter
MAPHQEIELNTLNTLKLKEESLAHGSSFSMREPDYNDTYHQTRYFDRLIDSFKRDPNTALFPSDHLGHVESGGRMHNGTHYYDLHQANLETAHSGLARKLKGRHLQMIAIGGSIGTQTPIITPRSLCDETLAPIPLAGGGGNMCFHKVWSRHVPNG